MGTLDGRVALVTGGGRGIGRGCALELAKQGAVVALCDGEGAPTTVHGAIHGLNCSQVKSTNLQTTG